MKIETYENSNFKSISVKKSTPVVSLLISADCFTENTTLRKVIFFLYTDLLFAGAGKYSREDFIYALKEIGVDLSVKEKGSRVTVLVQTLEKNLNKTLKLLEVMLLSPTFNESELERAVSTAKNGLVQYQDNARALAQDGLCRLLYTENDRNHNFTPELLKEALDKVTVDDLRSLHREFLSTFWLFSVGGEEAPVNKSLDFIKKIKKSEPETSPKEVVSDPRFFTGKKLDLQNVPSKQNVELSIGGPVPLTLADDDLPAFIFGLAVLGKWGGFSGRLMSTVREQEGLTYGIYAKTEAVTKNENGYWRIMTFFSPKDTVKGINSTLREIKKIREKGITVSEWERFKVILKTQETLAKDSLAGTVTLMHSVLTAGLSLEEYKNYSEKLYTCSRKSVNEALKKYLNPDNLVISAAGPVEQIKKDLKGIVSK